jgi:electron transfer flavoprotein alpha subunit
MNSLIYIEPSEGTIDPNIKKTILRLKKSPAQSRGLIKGIVIGSQLKENEDDLKRLFDELITVGIPQGAEYNTEIIANILTDLLKENSPSLLFMVFSHLGMELAPVIGLRLSLPTVAGCSDFNLAENQANVKRLIYGSKLTVSLSMDTSRGGILSILKGSLKENEKELAVLEPTPLKNTSLPWNDKWQTGKSQVIRIVEEEGSISAKEDITKASLLVSLGRGIGGTDNIPLMRKLADQVGGVISCSRPVVDNGWLPHYCQVGASGKTVSPVIYFALGISGQGNHLAGMDSSRIIVAVNKDPKAPIFKVAHYGVVDDMFQIVPEIIKQTEVKS